MAGSRLPVSKAIVKFVEGWIAEDVHGCHPITLA